MRWGELDLVLDLHATSSHLGTYIYGNSYDDVYRHERHIVFPKMVSHACEDYILENTIYNRDPQKSQTARRWLCNNLKDSVNVYCIHTSLLGYRRGKGEPLIRYTQDSYVRVGRNLVRAILDYFQFLGIIPFFLPDALPLHDLPRIRPGSPASSEGQYKLRVMSMSRSRSKQVQRTYSDETQGPKAEEEGSGGLVLNLESASSSSESFESGDHDKQSDSSGLIVKIVKNPLSFSSSAGSVSSGINDDHNNAEARILKGSFILPTSSKPNIWGRVAATTLLQPFPDDDLRENRFSMTSLPELPSLRSSLPRKLSPAGRNRTTVDSSPKSTNYRRKKKKHLSWKQPVAAENEASPVRFRYFDFRRISRTKTRSKKRSGRKSRKPRSRSRSSSRTKPTHQRNPLRKKKIHVENVLISEIQRKSTGEASTSNINSGKSGKETKLENDALSRSTSQKFPKSSVAASLPKGNLKRIVVNELTIGGYKHSSQQGIWHKGPAKKSQIEFSSPKKGPSEKK